MNIQDAVTQIHLAARYIGRDASGRDPGHGAMKPIQRKSQPLPLNPVFSKIPLDDQFFIILIDSLLTYLTHSGCFHIPA